MNPNLIILFFSIIMIRGCCEAPNRVEPSLPRVPLGWNYRVEKGVHVQGDFLLHKGEATSNNKIQVKVQDILAGDPCAEPAHYLSNPSVKLQFIRLSDNKVICEGRFFEGESSIMGSPNCSDELYEFGLGAIHVSAVNLKDGWVFFGLVE